MAPIKIFCVSILGFICLTILSLAGWNWPVLGSVITVLLVLAWFLVAWRNLPLAVVLLVAELVVGSFGYLTSLIIGSMELSLRLLLFLTAFGVMLYHLAANRQHVIFRHNWRWWFVGALVALLWAASRGYYNWNSFANLVLDANGYLYLLLLPLFLEAYTEARRVRVFYYVKLVLWPAVIWLSLSTLVLLYLFTHFEAGSIAWVYKWYRDSGLGEITPAGSGFFRVFSQSHLYSSLASVAGFAWLWQKIFQDKSQHWREPMLILTLVALTALLASLSRSLWLGAAAAWLLIPLLAAGPKKIKRALWYILTSVVLVASASGLVLATARLTWPVPPLGEASAQAFANRFGAEPAAQARLKLLSPLLLAISRAPVMGSGFGATVNYYSADPRAVKATAGGTGLVTTYAFEWGYLDLWYKFGLIGLWLYLMWLAWPWFKGLKLWRQGAPGAVEGAAGLALTAVYVTHLTTPYLNHPLGLGAVLALGAVILAGARSS